MLEPISGNPIAAVLLSGAADIDGELQVSWQGRASQDRFSYAWLRDHCHAKESLHPDTLQRQVDTFTIPADIAPAKVEITDGGGRFTSCGSTTASRAFCPRHSCGTLPKTMAAKQRRGGICGIARRWARIFRR